MCGGGEEALDVVDVDGPGPAAAGGGGGGVDREWVVDVLEDPNCEF